MSREERNALKAIDNDVLDKLIAQSLDEKRPSLLRGLQLKSCGPYVASRLREFENSLAAYGAAKAARKLAETEFRARRTGSDLAYAVRQMKNRVDTEEKEDQLFYVDEQIMSPDTLSEHLTVRVSYRWRPTTEDNWEYGSISFIHDVDFRPDYNKPPPKRKPSASKQEQDRQDKLYRNWEQLMKMGMRSVKEFFRAGGNATAIPKTFQAKADSYTQGLNNFSAQFWPERP